jgi:hypothetical protein
MTMRIVAADAENTMTVLRLWLQKYVQNISPLITGEVQHVGGDVGLLMKASHSE